MTPQKHTFAFGSSARHNGNTGRPFPQRNNHFVGYLPHDEPITTLPSNALLSFGPFSIQNGLLPLKPKTLRTLTPQTRDAIEAFAKEKISENGEPGAFQNSRTFARLALYLATLTGVNEEACWAAAILRKMPGSPNADYFPGDRTSTKRFLESLGFDERFVSTVDEAIYASRCARPGGSFSLEVQVLWEATSIRYMGLPEFVECFDRTSLPGRTIKHRISRARENYSTQVERFQIPLLAAALKQANTQIEEYIRAQEQGRRSRGKGAGKGNADAGARGMENTAHKADASEHKADDSKAESV